jgi:hypothetical protein
MLGIYRLIQVEPEIHAEQLEQMSEPKQPILVA